MLRTAFILLTLLLVPSSADAAKRAALVIGNSAYKYAGELTNPRNDASDMAIALKSLGFQVVDGYDLDKASFDRKIRDFAAVLEGAEAGVFFYAGHGLQVGGQNYLVPVDAQLTTVTALEFEMVRVDVVHRVMEQLAATNIIFLDACRNNPLARNLARAMGTRSAQIGSGLAPVESGVGTLISFSTQPGNVALDGTGRNSPFAAALVKRLATSHEDLSALLIEVRNDVRKDTQGKQIPWEHLALTGRFYFNVTINVLPQPPPPAQSSEAERAWLLVKDSTDQSVFEEFVKRYGDTFFAALARARLDELKKKQVASVPAPSAEPAPRQWDYGPVAPPVRDATRVTGFTYRTPPQEVDPGLRIFRLEADNTWSNTYPSGHVDRGGRIRARVILDGCNGTVIGKDSEPEFAVFIPDKGCPGMMARWRRGSGNWNILGQMQNVR